MEPILQSTGVTSMTMTDHTSGFNIVKNISWDNRYATMFGLTKEEVKKSLELILGKDQKDEIEKHYGIMERLFNGYYFSEDSKCEKVFNTNTCLEFFENLKLGKFSSPSNSEVSESLLTALAGSEFVVELLKKYVNSPNGIPYGDLPENIRLNDLQYSLRRFQSYSHVQSLLVHLGALTFNPAADPNSLPTLKIPNIIAKQKFIEGVFSRYQLTSRDISDAIVQIGLNGDVLPLMRFVSDLLPQTIKHEHDHKNWNEDRFRDWLGLTFLQFPQLVTLLEAKTIKDYKRADIFISPKRSNYGKEESDRELKRILQQMKLIPKIPHLDKLKGAALLELKVIKGDFLKVVSEVSNGKALTTLSSKILELEKMDSVDSILNIPFEDFDMLDRGLGKGKGGNIKTFVENICVKQLFGYYQGGIKGTESYRETMKLYVVVLIAGRKLLIAEVDKIDSTISYTLF